MIFSVPTNVGLQSAISYAITTERSRRSAPLQQTFTGYFTDYHAFLLRRMLARVDAIDADIAALDGKIEEMIAPFRRRGKVRPGVKESAGKKKGKSATGLSGCSGGLPVADRRW